MASIASMLEAPIPRPIMWAGVPFAGLVLTMLFVFLGFPYDELGNALAQRLGEASGSEVRIGGISPRITIGGPGFTARDVSVSVGAPQPRTFEIDPLRLRPAWSLSWLRGKPALRIDLESPIGGADGTLVLGEESSWDGVVTQVDLAQLPASGMDRIGISGLLTAAVDVVFLNDGPEGELSFQADDGSMSHPNLPMELPYDTLSGDLVLGGDHLATVNRLELEGPVVSATLNGSITRGKRRGQELLDLNVAIEIKNRPMQAMLRQMGVDLAPDGKAEFKLVGNLQNPRIR